jgi:hypothetical protein
MRRTFTAIAALGLVLAACGGGELGSGTTATTSTPGTTTPLEPPSEIMLEVRDEGGFVMPSFLLTRVPRFVLMSDGTLYGPGMQTAVYPGPLFPAVQVVEISDEAMAEIRQYIEDIGFADIVDERNQDAAANVADAPDTVVTVFDSAGAHSFSVYALGIDGVNFKDTRVIELNSLVMALDAAMAAGTPAGEFTPDRFEVYAWTAPAEPGTANPVEWPFGIEYSAMTDTGVDIRCAVFGGSEAARLLGVLGDANEATAFRAADGSEYQVGVRPLWPHQTSTCAAG